MIDIRIEHDISTGLSSVIFTNEDTQRALGVVLGQNPDIDRLMKELQNLYYKDDEDAEEY